MSLCNLIVPIKLIVWLPSITLSTIFETQKAIVTILEPKREKITSRTMSQSVCECRSEQFKARREHTASKVSWRGETNEEEGARMCGVLGTLLATNEENTDGVYDPVDK